MGNDKKTDLDMCIETAQELLTNQKEEIQAELEKDGFAVVGVKHNKCMLKVIFKYEVEEVKQ